MSNANDPSPPQTKRQEAAAKRLPRHIQLRGGIYYYRRNVPADVVPIAKTRVWKESLKTSELRKAEIEARRLGHEHDELIREYRQQPEIDRRLREHRQASQRNLEALARWRKEGAGQSSASRIASAAATRAEEAVSAAIGKHVPLEKIDKVTELLDAQEDDRARLAALKGDPCPQDFERVYNRTKAAVATLSTADLAEKVEDLTADIAKREIDIKRAQKALEPLELSTRVGAFDDIVATDKSNPRVKAILPIWFDKKKQGKSATKRHNVSIKRWIALHGNTPIKDITRQHVLAYVDCIAKLSDHRKLPAHKRGSLETHADLPKVTAKTVDRHLTSIKALLSFGVTQGWITHNVANGVSPPKDDRPKSSKRLPFTAEQRSLILARAIEDEGPDSEMAWLIRLGAYTGARIEELLQLRPKHVTMHEGCTAIEITDYDGGSLKSEPSLRHIPLHPAIAKKFVAWAHKPYRDRVFMSFRRGADGRYGNAASGAFGRLLDRAGLNDKRLVFHSFRHALKRAMTDARLDPDARRVILGHAGDSVHDKYAGGSFKFLAEEVARLPVMFEGDTTLPSASIEPHDSVEPS